MKIDKWYVIDFLIALAFAIFIQTLPLEYSEDYEGYIDYVMYADEKLEYFSDSPSELVANEPIWLVGNSLLYAVVDDPDVAVRAVIFLVSLGLGFAVVSIDRRNVLLLVIFLFLPQMFHNFTTHVRQGMAMAVLYLAYFMLGRRIGAPFILATPLIHSSMFFIAPLVYVIDAVRALRLNTIQSVFFLFGLFLVLAMATGLIAGYLGARQANTYEFGSVAGSGLGLLFWLGVGYLVFREGKRFYWKHIVGVSVLFMYYATYLFVEASGRILEAGLPFVFALIIDFTGWRRLVFWGVFAVYFVLSWYMKVIGDEFFHGVFTGDFWIP